MYIRTSSSIQMLRNLILNDFFQKMLQPEILSPTSLSRRVNGQMDFKLINLILLTFIPGLRNCIGQKFAVLEMKTIIHQILLNFKLTAITKREEIVFVADLVLRAQHPILIQFERR